MAAVSTSQHPLARPLGSAPRSGPFAVVLGLDPGLQRTGYGALAVAEGRAYVREAGVLVTRSHDGLAGRLQQLYRDLLALLRDLRPQLVVLEDLFVHHRFPRTALVLGHVRGIIMLAATAEGVRVVELPPSSVKQAVAGTGRATKLQVQHGVRRLLGVRRVTNAHAADALALAYAGWVRTAGMSGGLVRSVAPRDDGRVVSGARGRRPPGVRR